MRLIILSSCSNAGNVRPSDVTLVDLVHHHHHHQNKIEILFHITFEGYIGFVHFEYFKIQYESKVG